MNISFFGFMGASLGFYVKAFYFQPMCHTYVKKSVEANNFLCDHFKAHSMGLGDGDRVLVKPFLVVHVGVCHRGYSWPDCWGGKMEKVLMHILTNIIGSCHIIAMKIGTEENMAIICQKNTKSLRRGRATS